MRDLPQIVTAAIIVDTITVGVLYIFNRGGDAVKEWYREFRLGAACMDVSSLIIAAGAASALGNSLPAKLGFVIAFQVVHDILAGLFVRYVKTESTLVKLWKRYASEVGFTILVVDAIMLVSTLLLVHYFEKINVSVNVFVYSSIAVFYVLLLFVYSF